MKKRTFKYVLPTLFVGAQTFAGTLENFNKRIDAAIAKAQSSEKIAEFCRNAQIKTDEAYKSKSNAVWAQVLREVNESNLDGVQADVSLNAGPLRVEFGYDAKSDYIAPKKQAGEDKFHFSLGLAFSLLDSDIIPFGFRLKDAREITFTRMYEEKCTSLVRVPYNPVTRMPITAEKALALEVGELVNYTAPFTVSLNVGKFLDVNYYRTADVEVNVFKMSKSLVRVRMVARKEKGIDFSARKREKIARVIRLYEVRANIKSSNSEAKLIDYVFDLSDANAREAYNKLIAPHNITNFDGETELQKAAVTFFGKSESLETLMIDEESVLDAAKNNPKNVISLMSTDSDITAVSSGFSLNFLNAISFSKQANYADGHFTRKDDEGQTVDTFNTRTIESITRSKFVNFASKDQYQLGTLLIDEKNDSPLGFQLTKISNKQKLSDLSASRWSAYLKYLPMTQKSSELIDSKLEKFKGIGRLKTNENIFINAEKFFKNASNINSITVQKKMEDIFNRSITTGTMLTSEPSGEFYYTKEIRAQKVESHSRYLTYPNLWNGLSAEKKLEEYKWIYQYEYNTAIPGAFEKIANVKLDRHERLLAFNTLMESPLFNEIGIGLLSQIIPSESLEETVVYEVLIQPENSEVAPLQLQYGDKEQKHYITSQNAIIAKNFSLEPGAQLRIYLKKDGNLKTLPEIISETGLPSNKSN